MFHTGYFVKEEEMFVSPNIFTNLHIIMCILIGFSVGGGGRNVYQYQIMQGSLGLARGCGCGRKKLLLY